MAITEADYQALKQRCLDVAQARNEDKPNPLDLSQCECEDLISAILPALLTIKPPLEDDKIRIAVRFAQRDMNEYRALQSPHSQEGERCWDHWRDRFVREGQLRGLANEDAEDLAQDTSLRAMAALQNYHFQSSLHTYLLKVFAYTFLDRLRQKQRQKQHEPVSIDDTPNSNDGSLPPWEPPDPAPPIDATIADAEILAHVTAELQRVLKSEHFEMFRLRYVEVTYWDPVTKVEKEWTYQAIADKLGCPRDKVSAFLQRVILSFRPSGRFHAIIEPDDIRDHRK